MRDMDALSLLMSGPCAGPIPKRIFDRCGQSFCNQIAPTAQPGLPIKQTNAQWF